MKGLAKCERGVLILLQRILATLIKVIDTVT